MGREFEENYEFVQLKLPKTKNKKVEEDKTIQYWHEPFDNTNNTIYKADKLNQNITI